MNRYVAGLILALLAAGTSAPAAAQSYPAQILFKGNQTAAGETIAYPKGTPQVTAAIVTLMPGEKTLTHRHGVPMFAYILEGEITVDYGAKGRKSFKAGQSLLEAMDVPHAGMNLGSVPVRLLAVYMGADGAADVLPEK